MVNAEIQPGWEPLVYGVMGAIAVVALVAACVIGWLVSRLAAPDDRARVAWSTIAVLVGVLIGAVGFVVNRSHRPVNPVPSGRPGYQQTALTVTDASIDSATGRISVELFAPADPAGRTCSQVPHVSPVNDADVVELRAYSTPSGTALDCASLPATITTGAWSMLGGRPVEILHAGGVVRLKADPTTGAYRRVS